MLNHAVEDRGPHEVICTPNLDLSMPFGEKSTEGVRAATG